MPSRCACPPTRWASSITVGVVGVTEEKDRKLLRAPHGREKEAFFFFRLEASPSCRQGLLVSVLDVFSTPFTPFIYLFIYCLPRNFFTIAGRGGPPPHTHTHIYTPPVLEVLYVCSRFEINLPWIQQAASSPSRLSLLLPSQIVKYRCFLFLVSPKGTGNPIPEECATFYQSSFPHSTPPRSPFSLSFWVPSSPP